MWKELVEHLSKPEAIGLYLAGLALGFWKGVLPAISAWATKKFLKGDPGPQTPKAEPTPVATEPVHAQLSEVAKAMSEWTLDEARRRVRQLQAEVDSLQETNRRKQYDVDDTSRDNVRTSRALAQANIEIERLQEELELARNSAAASELRARRATMELVEYKREVSGGHSPTNVTPLRPKPIR